MRSDAFQPNDGRRPSTTSRPIENLLRVKALAGSLTPSEAKVAMVRRVRYRPSGTFDELLPLLRGRVFHVTPGERLPAIKASGIIRANRDGALGESFPQSRKSVGRTLGYVCLFDFRSPATEEQMRNGLSCFWLASPTIGVLMLAPTAYDRLVLSDDVTDPALMYARVPYVECWYPSDLPFFLVEETVILQEKRRRPTWFERMLSRSR